MPTHEEKMDQNKIRLISFVSFLMGFSQALLFYVMSTYFKRASGIENLGVFYFFSYVVVLSVLLNAHKIIRATGQANFFYFSLLFKIIVITLLMLFPPSAFGAGLMMLYIVFGSIEWVGLDVILESYSSDAMSGRIRGKHLAIMNAGFLLGPFLSTILLSKFDFFGVFLALFLFNAAVFILAILSFRDANHRNGADINVLEVLKKISKRKNILRIYYISYVLEFFYALVVIYTPLYLRDLGMDWRDVGIVFTVMLTPFVFLQYPMGILADKRYGEKEFLIISIIISGMATAAIFFISTPGVFVWSLILLATRIGAALIEILRDSYFYKRIDHRDVDMIDFFRTAQSSAYITSAVISTVILFFFPIKVMFLVIAAVVLSALYPAIGLVDNKCEREMGKCQGKI
jgi:MFS family permease